MRSLVSLDGRLRLLEHDYQFFKIVKYETLAFKRKTEIKPLPTLFFLLNISLLPRTTPSDTVVRFRVRFYAQFHRLCYKTIGSCFYLCTIELNQLLNKGHDSCLKEKEHLFSLSSLAWENFPSLCRSMRSFSRANDAKIVCSRNAQCNTEESP